MARPLFDEIYAVGDSLSDSGGIFELSSQALFLATAAGVDTQGLQAIPVRKVDEITHALGEVSGNALVCDLDRAPGPVGIEEDKHVGRAVAAILTVVALELTWRGVDGRADLANELVREARRLFDR